MSLRSVGLAAALAVALMGCRGGSSNEIDAGNNPNDDGGPDDGITIYDIQTPGGEYSLPGTVVPLLDGVVIVAIDRFGNRTGTIYVMEPEGGAYSGVLVFNPTVGGGGTIDDLAVGDLVDVEGGMVDEFALDTDVSGRTLTELVPPEGATLTVTKRGEGTVPAPEVVDPVLLGSDDAEAEKWEGVLITIENVAVTFAADGVSGTDPTLAEMTVTGPFRVSSSLAPLLNDTNDMPLHPRDTCFTSITGMGDYFFNYKVLPRDPSDIVTGDASNCLYEDSVAECHEGTDDDHDGFTDCQDFSCQTADPDGCTATTTISDVQMGTVAPGSLVSLSNVVVTAHRSRRLYVQEAGATHAGVLVFFGTAPAETYTPGQVVTVEGTVTEYFGMTEITNPMVTDSGTTAPVPAPVVLTAGTILDDVAAEAYEGMLVQIETVQVVEFGPMAPEYHWTVTDGTNNIRVGTSLYIIPMGSEPQAGDCYGTLTGPLNYSYDEFKIEPRGAADLAAGACP